MNEPEIIPFGTVLLSAVIYIDLVALAIVLVAALRLRKQHGGFKQKHVDRWLNDNTLAGAMVFMAEAITVFTVSGYAIMAIAQWIN